MIAEVERLLRALAAVEGVTSGAGNVNTLVDATLPYPTAGAYWIGRVLVMLSGAAKGQTTVIVADDGAGTLTLRPALSAAPGITQPYLILKQVGDIVAVASTDENYTPSQNIGNKTDVAALDDMSDITNRSIQARIWRVLLRVSALRMAELDPTGLPADIAALETKLDAGGLGSGKVTKALTFANQTGQVPLFTVTGDVIVRIVAVVKTNCGSAGGCNVSVGIAADVDAIIPVTDITLLAAQEIWFDATPDSEIEALGTMREHIISDGNDITLNSSAADNSGAITFYCFWTALSAGATVVAA